MSRKLQSPKLFSAHFDIDPAELDMAGLFDPILNCDTPLFVDPLLLRTSSNEVASGECYDQLRARFANVVRLLDASQNPGDPAWKAAERQLDLSERPETCLGFGGGSIRGSSRPDALRTTILKTTKEIVRLGENDPEIISLMGMFEDGVGPDTISDLTTTAISKGLAKLTSEFAVAHGITVKNFPQFFGMPLPSNPYRPNTPVLLVPSDVLRDLPLATDWSDVSEVAFQNQLIRDAFNSFVGDISKATVSDKKHAIKRAAMLSLENFRALLEAVLSGSTNYDPNEDILGFYAFRKVLSGNLDAFRGGIAPPRTKSKEEIVRIVGEIIVHFRRLVEENNNWELLWSNGRPRKERAAQLLFFAVSDAYCQANNVDISPEMNPGGGPVDFKFSSGYANRVLVEVKRSMGAVKHGYEKQLEVYKAASNTDAAYFLVIEFGDNWDAKLQAITDLRNAAVIANEPASLIEIVDASQRTSASKR